MSHGLRSLSQKPSMRPAAVLDEIDALPCPQHQRASNHRDGELRLRERGADMGRHVVRAFDRVAVGEVLRRKLSKHPVQVGGHVGVGVLGADGTSRSPCVSVGVGSRRPWA